MNDSVFWRLVAVLGVIGLFYVGHGLHITGDAPMFTSVAEASGAGTATDDVETVFTSSADGKTVYVWQYYSSRPPKYVGKSDAVLKK